MLEKNNEIKEKDIEKVVGGNETTYKYVLTDKDWVYESNIKNIKILILENVSTNDSSKKITCRKTYTSITPSKDGGTTGNYSVSVSTILSCYQNHGGVLNAMNI